MTEEETANRLFVFSFSLPLPSLFLFIVISNKILSTEVIVLVSNTKAFRNIHCKLHYQIKCLALLWTMK